MLCFPKLFSDLTWFCADFTQPFPETSIDKTKQISEHPYEIGGFSGKHLRAHSLSSFKSVSEKSNLCMRTKQQPTSGSLYNAGNILSKITNRRYSVDTRSVEIFEHKAYKNRRTWKAIVTVRQHKRARQQQVQRSWGHTLPQHVMQLCSSHPSCCLNSTLTTPAISAQWSHPQFFPHLASMSISHSISLMVRPFFPPTSSLFHLLDLWSHRCSVTKLPFLSSSRVA